MTCDVTALLPDDPTRIIDAPLAAAASMGVGAFAAPDVQFSPDWWKKNPSFDPACMGMPLMDSVRSFLRTRFPLARAVAPSAAGTCVDLPSGPDEVESLLLSLAGRDV
jgi:hypothetical protein